jgi:outer membrane protein TolC
MSRSVVVAVWLAVLPSMLQAQPASPSADAPGRVTFAQAIDLALQRNVTVQEAAEEILRAQGLLREATANILPSVSGSLATTTLNEGEQFEGAVTTARNQVVATVTVSGLAYAPVQWALRVQAADNVHVAELAAADIKRQIAQATAQAYLAIIARSRVVDADVRARDVARAHYELAKQLREAGGGSVLNELRAQQSFSGDDVLVQQSELDLYRAEEALGVLLERDGPVAAADEPPLDVPADLEQAVQAMPDVRSDLRLAVAREQAATRVANDSWKDWLPSVGALFEPEYTTPQTLFQPNYTWTLEFVGKMTFFDGGFRRAQKSERQALVREATLARRGLLTQARSDVRAAREALRLALAAQRSARAAADQAARVLDIVNISFKAGAVTNIEVIDAQRVARDADTDAAVAEDQVRQARLALLIALGRFP